MDWTPAEIRDAAKLICVLLLIVFGTAGCNAWFRRREDRGHRRHQ